MLKNFRTYQLAVKYYRSCITLKLPRHLKDQLSRSSSSIAINLAEGSGKNTFKDRRKYYHIAMGSFRESQAILELSGIKQTELFKLEDHLGASLYKLINWTP